MMEKEKHIEHIAELLGKFAAGRITDDERAELARWGAGSERAGRLLGKIGSQAGIGEQDARRFAAGADTDTAWSELCARISHARRRRRLGRILRYGAVAVVIAATGLFALRHGGRLADAPQIYAPVDAAVLELPGGTSVELRGAEADRTGLLTLYGTSDDGRTLTYNGADTLQVVPQCLRVGCGGEFLLTLADGTRVWVNSGTTVTYPNRFVGVERRVEVDGEAYFDVAHDVRPFIVHTAGMDVRVTGTEFNVMAYPDSRTIEVTLVEGGVSAGTPSGSVDLLPGQRAVYSPADDRLIAEEVDVDLYTSWRNGIFEFRATPLEDIIPRLERWYDVEVFFEEEAIGKIRFTGAVEKSNPLNYLLDILSTAKSLEYSVSGRTVTIGHRR